MTTTQRQAAQRKAEAAERRAKKHEEALAQRSADDLRSPICCILGHVDTGKTKLLDKVMALVSLRIHQLLIGRYIDTANKCSRGRSRRYHPANWCYVFPSRRHQDKDRGHERCMSRRVISVYEVDMVLAQDGTFDYKVPGLLIIDTPGHESFTNLRSRGSSLCNIAILVVDIMV